MECGRMINDAALLDIKSLNGSFSPEVFNTTTTIFPSGFINAVDSSLSRFVEQLMRLAPALMNFEK